MSSILKILVDIQCLFYCDLKQVGEALPNSIFKLELRKGTYILEFRIKGKTIISKEYIIQGDSQEYLLRINLSDEVLKIKREQKCSEIANINADIQYKDSDWWIINKDNGCEIRLLYNLADYSYSDRKSFDMVGLRSVNIGGKKVDNWAYYTIEGGKWGCINKQGEMQIPAIYDKSIYFYNDKVTNAFLEGKNILINKYGEQLYEDLYDSLKGDFLQNQIVCKNGKYGVIDTNGIYIIPAIYDNLDRLDRDDIRFIIMVNNKNGIADHNNNLLLPCIYDSIVCNKYIISVCRNDKWGIFDYNLNPIVSTEYEILEKDHNDKRPVLVRKNGYYGILNINISEPEDVSRWNGELNHISEIVPCIYNVLYNEYGKEIDPHEENVYNLDRLFFVNKDKETLHCYKYKLQKHEELNRRPTYTAICVKQFSCENFGLVYGEPYQEYLIYTNKDVSTLTDDIIHISLKLDNKERLKIIKIPHGNKHVLQIDNNILVFENDNLIDCIENAKLCNNHEIVYGIEKDGKYAIYSSEFVQCTPFEYNSLSIECENNDYDIVEFSKITDNRRLYGEYSYKTKSVISFGFLRERYIRSQYNWAEKYDQNTGKEGIISIKPQGIVVPYNYEYIRFYTGKKSTVFVVAKEFANRPQKRYALMNTKFELLTSYIFKNVKFYWGKQGYLNDIHLDLIHNDEIYSNFDLSLNDIERFAPFLGYEHDVADEYDECNRPIRSHSEVAPNPFKNVRLFIDTETTGLPINDNLPYTELDNWPHLVQVALIIEDDNYGILAKRNIILKPNGYIIPESSTQIHGIAHGWAEENGDERDKVISFLDLVLYNSDIIIGHNVAFDLNVIKSEIIRIKGMENVLFTKKKHSVVDTMLLGVNICKLPNLSFHTRKIQSYKYPKLDELYYKLFNKHFDNQHDAMADIQVTYDCYNKLKRKSE